MVCLVVLSVGIILISDLYHHIIFINTDTVTNSVYFIVLEFFRLKIKVNMRGKKIIPKSIVKVTYGLIITIKNNMIEMIIYLLCDHHSHFFQMLQEVDDGIIKRFCSK